MKLKANRPIFFLVLWTILGILYFPFFVVAWCLHVISRLLLSISYFGMLNGKRGRDVFVSLFRFNPTL